jgi:hypothetical protein
MRGVAGVELVQGVVNTVMNIHVAQKAGNFLAG